MTLPLQNPKPFELEEREKFIEAERQAAWVRLIFSVFGVVYLVWNQDDPRMAWGPAWVTLAVIWIYTSYVLVHEPYRDARPGLWRRYGTTLLDAVLSTAWIGATGGWSSSWYPLYLAMTAATAFRFNYRETFLAASSFASLFVGMLLITGTLPVDAPEELTLRILFILIVAALCGPLAQRAFEHAVMRAAAQDAAEQARRLEKLKDEFFANVSHELRTPLTLIMGPAERLAASPNLSAEQRSELDIIVRNARNLQQHVNDLLDVSRLVAGQARVDYARTELTELLRVTASNFELLAAERKLEYVLEVPDSLPAVVDPHKYRRIVENLLSNAFKFTPDGGVVRCTLALEGRQIVLEVADSGPGIPSEYRDRVFERFRQLDRGIARRFDGTGLGLAIVKNFVDLHRGRVGIGDAAEGGALFRVEIPRRPAGRVAVRQADVVQIAAQPRLESTPVPPLERPGVDEEDERPLVLVVEDSPDMNRFIRQILASTYRTAGAFDGADGLEKAQTLRPDLILSDVMMPEFSGEDLVEALQKHPDLSHIPIILLTAKVEDELRARLLAKGARDYVIKPFSAEELRARVRNLIRVKRSADLLRRELQTRSDDLDELARELTRKQRELQTALQATGVAREQAERASALKTSILSATSHELRTPLASLRLQLERLRLQGDELPQETRQLVGRMSIQTERLHTLIESLLHYARVQSGKLRTEIEHFDPAALVADCIEQVAPRAAQKDLPLSLHAPEHIEGFVSDPRLVRLIVATLLDNAVKFTEQGQVDATVRATPSRVQIEIRDTGPGIAPERQARVFDLFEPAEDLRREPPRATSLGLALVREMIFSLGGDVVLESQVGVGSTFTITLPSLEHAIRAESNVSG